MARMDTDQAGSRCYHSVLFFGQKKVQTLYHLFYGNADRHGDEDGRRRRHLPEEPVAEQRGQVIIQYTWEN